MTDKDIKEVKELIDEELKSIRKSITLMTWGTFILALSMFFHIVFFPLLGKILK